MKITVKYKELEVEFDSNNFENWQNQSKNIIKQLKGIYEDNSEYEKF